MPSPKWGRPSMSGGNPPADLAAPVAVIAERIRARYSNPSRKAYTYLYWVRDVVTLTDLIPTPEAVIAAWVDEGAGFVPTAAEAAVSAGHAAAAIKPHQAAPSRLTPHQRKQMMARAIAFTATQTGENEVTVQLVSRSLGFFPKGQREVTERWLRTVDGTWYSAYRSDQDEDDA
jgi:hypothetical protein